MARVVGASMVGSSNSSRRSVDKDTSSIEGVIMHTNRYKAQTHHILSSHAHKARQTPHAR
jgi:hypothetical protein